MLLLFNEKQCIAPLSCFVQVWNVGFGTQVGALALAFDHICIGKCFFSMLIFLISFSFSFF
jgi:hypothetical protein